MTKELKRLGWRSLVLALAFSTILLPPRASAQDDQDDPPTRVARLGYMEGSVSFQPAGEDEWVQAVPNRPMTTGDKLWADRDSRVELQLGSAVIRLGENTGVSFLNLDDHTLQLQLSSGAISVRVRRLDPDDDFEVDTPNLAFTVSEPGSYRLKVSENGTYTVVGLRAGGGQATGNGQTYTMHAGQQGTFSGTESLNADVEDIGGPDAFDNWAYARDLRYDESPSAHYLAWNVVGYEDLDANGDWRDDPSYGHIWFPHIEAGWAPYHTGHWDWISPWGYTWVDDSPWGYAPFHYGRWVSVGGRWGWIAGPPTVQAVYAPALVVFIGGGPGGWGGNVGWFPLGPREVYVPPYYVSRGYMNQVNISNTTVNVTQVTNVYNTTIVNKTTTITNITYANRGVQGAVMVVPQRAFASAQPVAHVAVAVNAQQLASAPVSARVAVVPTPQAVLGARASTAGHVTAPPAAVMSRAVIAKRTPPPPPVPFAAKQRALAAHPGEPLSRQELQAIRPTGAAAPRPMVRVAPPGKPATPTMGHPTNPPGQPNAGRPGQPPANEPINRAPAQPATNERPNNERPNNPRPVVPSEPNRPPAAQPNRPMPPSQNRPENNRPENTRPEPNRPEPKANQPAPRPQAPPPAEREPQRTPPPAAKPAPPPPHQQPKQTPEQKKQEDEKKKEKPPGA